MNVNGSGRAADFASVAGHAVVGVGRHRFAAARQTTPRLGQNGIQWQTRTTFGKTLPAGERPIPARKSCKFFRIKPFEHVVGHGAGRFGPPQFRTGQEAIHGDGGTASARHGRANGCRPADRISGGEYAFA